MGDRRVGKPSASRLQKLLGTHFGAPSDQVLVGPGPGLDAAVLSLGPDQVMAIAEDPIFPAPGLPLDLLGWFTVHIGASDVAVTGIAPQFMTYTLLLPPTCPEADAETIITAISAAARDLNIAIVGGHTGWYDAVTIPTVGGVTVWGMAPTTHWASPGGAQDGDVLLMTKGPAIEAVALLAVVYKERLTRTIPAVHLEQALERVQQITVVRDALSAFATGGIHAMHDATEGGVLGGVLEMAAAAGLSAAIDIDAIAVPEDIVTVASELGFDPWCAISEGTLLAAVAPDAVAAVQSRWDQEGIGSQVLGRFDASLPHSTVVRNGNADALKEPAEDPFWSLFFAGLQLPGGND